MVIDFRTIVLLQHGEEFRHLVARLRYAYYGTVFQPSLNLPLARVAHPLVYGVVMDRISNSEPAHREVTVLSEIAVAEQRLFYVAELQSKGMNIELLCKISQHLVEDLLLFYLTFVWSVVGRSGQEVFAYAVDIRPVGQGREAETAAGDT